MQVGKFLENIKRADQNKAVQGGNFFSKSINVQTKIRLCRGEFFLKINKRAHTSIWYTRVHAIKKCFSMLGHFQEMTSNPLSKSYLGTLGTMYSYVLNRRAECTIFEKNKNKKAG